MRTDPTDNGGLFVGRRPGTRPVRYRALPERGSDGRRAFDTALAAALLVGEVVICLLFWGPLPARVAVGGRSRSSARPTTSARPSSAAFAGLLATLLLGLVGMRCLDNAWILVRRAAGHDQRVGKIGIVFAVTSVVGASIFALWFFVIQRPRVGCCSPAAGRPRAWACSTTTSSSRGCPTRRSPRSCAPLADERRRKALERVEPLDLSGTTWHEFPHPDVVAAITYAARRGINRYADAHATPLRRELALRHGVEPDRIVVGNGAAELLVAAAHALLAPSDELVTPWPSYPLYPLMARRAGAHAVPVPGHEPEAILGAVTGDTRIVVLCNPNDPTGALPDRGSHRSHRGAPARARRARGRRGAARLRRRRAPDRNARRCSTSTRA